MKNFKRFPAAKTILFLLLVFSFFSCYRDKFDFDMLDTDGEWNPDVAVSAIYSNLTLADIINDHDYNNLVTDNTHFQTLIYSKKVYSRTAAELIFFPVQNLNTNIQFSVTGALPYGTDLQATPHQVNYSFMVIPDSVIIDEMTLKTGLFNFSVFSADLNHDATINISIPNATLGGIPFNQNINYVYNSNINQFFDISGYKLTFDNTGLNKNVLDIIYTITVHGNGNSNNSPYNLSLNESFSDIVLQKIEGDFKKMYFNFPGDSIEIRLFKNNIHGFIDFEDPKINFIATNSFGMPVRFNITNLKATEGNDMQPDVLISGVPSSWDINYPSISQIGQSVTTELQLDKTNSNVWNGVLISPKWFVADIAGVSNPTGGTSDNFANFDSQFDIDAQVELPLAGKTWNFIIQDTLDFELGEDLGVAEYLHFRINTTNGFPVEAIMQVYFLDENNQKLDSLLTPAQQIVAPAPCSSSPPYMVTQSVHKYTETTFEKQRISNLKQTKKALVHAQMLSSQSSTQIVNIYSDYNLLVQVGVRAKLHVTY
ncbi:MAG: hypothetical protein PHR81_05290 [Bacteroidales bacterium]|jgi:hypothetical protein|nr:hypothetical protein [Bacteroidales bacterium]MDD4214205.1 hypothetical protein [Bacteroidales bacterium]